MGDDLINKQDKPGFKFIESNAKKREKICMNLGFYEDIVIQHNKETEKEIPSGKTKEWE